jgi:hypothetical protein
MRRLVILCLCAAVLLVVAVPASGTRTVRIPSRVTIASSGMVMHGHVESPKHPCVVDRKVKLKRVISGGKDQVMGTATTNVHGRWRLRLSGFAGISLARFYARVRRRAEGTAGTIFVCRPDRSREVMIGS